MPLLRYCCSLKKASDYMARGNILNMSTSSTTTTYTYAETG